jgi:hypothetical protein
MRHPEAGADTSHEREGGDRMRSINWRHVLFTSATLATLLLAAGARFKPR